MAARYFVGGGTGNWNSTTNWSATSGGASGASFPIAGDDVFLDAASGANTLTINVTSACLTLNCTGFTGTLAGTGTLTISGNVTLSAAMTITHTGEMRIAENATLTSNGVFYTGIFRPYISGRTYTFADNWSVAHFDGSGSGTPTYLGGTITSSGDCKFQATAVASTTNFILNGTGTLSATAILLGTIDITINTLGTITLSGNFTFNSTGNFVVTAALDFVTTGTTITKNINATSAPVGTFDFGGFDINNLSLQQTGVLTIGSNTNVLGTLLLGFVGGGTTTINGFKISANGNIGMLGTGNVITGTTNIEILNTCLITSNLTSGALRNNLTLNSGVNTITFGSTFNYNTGTLTYTSGTVVTTGSTLTIAASTTLNTNGINWNNVTFSGTQTITLTSDLTINGTYTHATGACTFNGGNVYLGGNVTLLNGNVANGTATLIYNGTGIWSGNLPIQESFTINTAGTLTISGSVSFNTSTLTYTAGTVVTTGSTLTIAASTTLNTNGITWNNVNISSVTVTNNSILTVNGLLTYISYAVVLNGSDVILNGGFTNNSNSACTGTATIKFKNTGTWVHTSGGSISNNIVFDSGVNTITLGAIVRYATGTITYTSGVIDATTNNSTLSISVSCTLNTNGMSWNNIFVGASLTLNSLLSAIGTMTLPNTAITFTGTHGFTVGTLTHTTLTAVRTYTLASTKTYTITGAFTSNTNTSTIRPTFRSSTGGSQAILTLNAGATQSLQFVNATDIDSSLGQQIYSYKGVLSNATNWFSTNGDFLVLAY